MTYCCLSYNREIPGVDTFIPRRASFCFGDVDGSLSCYVATRGLSAPRHMKSVVDGLIDVELLYVDA